MANPDFLKKVERALLEGGTAAELEVAQIAAQEGWATELCPMYHDQDSGRWRETDVFCEKTEYGMLSVPHSVASRVTLALAVEVKRSAKYPWMVLRGAPLKPIDMDDVPLEAGTSFETLASLDAARNFYGDGSSLADAVGWIGASARELFKAPQAKSAPYKACISAIKSAQYRLKRDPLEVTCVPATISGAHRSIEVPQLILTLPVVVFDGVLLSAELVGADLKVEDIKWAPLRFSFQTKKYSERHHYVVSVVRLTAWREFLQLCAARFERMRDDMEAARKECQRLVTASLVAHSSGDEDVDVEEPYGEPDPLDEPHDGPDSPDEPRIDQDAP